MLPIRTILHPTDFSEHADHALPLAAALARDYNALLVVLHVLPLTAEGHGVDFIPTDSADRRAEARERLDQLPIGDDGPLIEPRLAEGEPAEVILHFARETSADLIVMNTHGRTGLARVLMGSVAEQVVRRAPCPVLTVRLPSSLAALETRGVEPPLAVSFT